MDIYIITGASKGIGSALCKQLLQKENMLFCISRTKNNEIEELAKNKNVSAIFMEQDLAKTEALSDMINSIVSLFPRNIHTVTLINNAGVIEPIGKTEDNDPKKIANSIAVNLTAPMILTSHFIKLLKDRNIAKKVINISSGAGRKPYPGWSTYCAGKAGLDHYTRTIAEEQKGEKHPVKVISIAPGIIDTNMQKTIRGSREEDFELVDRFIEYKEQGLLSSPEETADKLIKLLNGDLFWDLEPIVDLRNYSNL